VLPKVTIALPVGSEKEPDYVTAEKLCGARRATPLACSSALSLAVRGAPDAMCMLPCSPSARS
jgi:hypothetical protein